MVKISNNYCKRLLFDSRVTVRPHDAVVEGSFRVKDLEDGQLLLFASSSVEQVTLLVLYDVS